MLKNYFQEILYRISQPLVWLFIKLGITPNGLSVLGLLLNAAATLALIMGSRYGFAGAYPHLLLAGLLILLGGWLDVLDGRLARLTGQSSSAGALLDSVLDRYAELLMFLGIGWMAWQLNEPRSMLAAYLAAGFSQMVSYTRARSEGLGETGVSGLFQRPERIVLFSVGAMITGILGSRSNWTNPSGAWLTVLEPVLWIIAAGAAWTAIARLRTGYIRLLRKTEK